MDFLDAASVQDVVRKAFSTRLQPASPLHLQVQAQGKHCYSLVDGPLPILLQHSLSLAACIELRPLVFGLVYLEEATFPDGLSCTPHGPSSPDDRATRNKQSASPPPSATSACGCSAILPTHESVSSCYPVAH